jgi:catecholate siderophore receptor
VPGITFGAGEGGNPQGDRPFIRGFDAQGDTYLDGVRDTGARAARSSPSNRSKSAKARTRSAARRGRRQPQPGEQARARDFADGGFTWGSDQTQRYTSTATTSSATPLPAA